MKQAAIVCVCAALVVAVGCSRRTEEVEKREPRSEGSFQQPTRIEAKALRQQSAGRVVALGDTHGDLGVTRRVLRLAGAVDENDRWIGGDLVVVQTGDQVDRGPDDPDVIDYFERLEAAAGKAGGAVHSLLGNHEVWNVSGNFISVTREGFEDFASVDPSSLSDDLKRRYPRFVWGRLAAFAPGGPYARKLADRPVVLVVDDSLFVHGGVEMGHVRHGLEKINAEARAWLLGQSEAQPEALYQHGGEGFTVTWLRRYSDGNPTEQDCAEVARVLEAVGAKRMVMGHSIQEKGVTSVCEGKVWRIDVGLADVYQGPVQALEIRGGQVEILKGRRP